jgi:hypothetical protein
MLQPTLPAGLTEADQRFFAWMARSAWNSKPTRLLSRSGDNAISSDAAAMTDPKCGMGQEVHG